MGTMLPTAAVWLFPATAESEKALSGIAVAVNVANTFWVPVRGSTARTSTFWSMLASVPRVQSS
jgi:hypothetical protein